MAVTPADALPVQRIRTRAHVRHFLGASWRSYAVLGVIAAFLLALLLIPVGAVFITAFRDGDGSFTLGHFATFFSTGLMRESFGNSLYVAIASVIVASLIATPLAYITVRFQFRGATADPDAGRSAVDHAAVCRGGCDAVDLRPLGLGEPAARRNLRFLDSDHARAHRRRSSLRACTTFRSF